MDLVGAGLAGTIVKYCSIKEQGAPFPSVAEMSAVITKAVAGKTNRIDGAKAMKTDLDALADKKLAESRSGKG